MAALAAALVAVSASPAAAYPRRDIEYPATTGATVESSGEGLPVPLVQTDLGMDALGLYNIQVLERVAPQVSVGIAATIVHTRLWGTDYGGSGFGLVAELDSAPPAAPGPANPYVLKAALALDRLDGRNEIGGAHTNVRVWVADVLAGRRWCFAGGNVVGLAAGARLFDFRRAEFSYGVEGEGDLKLRFPVRRALLPALELTIGRGPG